MAVLSTQLQSGGWSAGSNVYQIQSEASKPRLILIRNDRVAYMVTASTAGPAEIYFSAWFTS